MGVSEPLVSSAGVVTAVVAVMVDGRRAVPIAAAVVALGLAPTVAVTSGPPAVLLLVVAGTCALLVALLAARAARRLPWVPGLDPEIPAFAPARRLFGRRSVRAWTAVLAIPVASWVSFNVPIGEVTAVQGILFPVAYVWACGTLRLLVARTVEDIAAGAAMIGLAAAAGWLVRGGADAYAGAMAFAGLTVLAAAIAGWLGGRYARRPQGEAS
jgi:hypothetical protein